MLSFFGDIMKNNKIPEIVELGQDIEVITSAFDSFREHRHEFCEFEYITEGEGEYVLNGEKYHISAGNLLYVTPLDLHSYSFGKGKYKTVTVKFSPENISHSLSEISSLASCVIRADKKMSDSFENILEEKKHHGDDSFAIRNCLERILVLFLRSCNSQRENETPYDIGQIIGYINRNFRSMLTLDEISRKCGCSGAHFCRQFRKSTGKTFVEYLNAVRAAHAKNLLITTDMTVTDIAYECGFGSVRNLNREFLKKYSVSPTQYRSMHS